MLVTLRSAPRLAEPQAYMCGKKINKLEKGMSLVTVKGKYGCRKSLVAFAPGARLRDAELGLVLQSVLFFLQSMCSNSNRIRKKKYSAGTYANV